MRGIVTFTDAWKRLIQAGRNRFWPNSAGTAMYPPGHFYSPLLDLRGLQPGQTLEFDGEEWWEHLDLREKEQRLYYRRLLEAIPLLEFPRHPTEHSRYFIENDYFVFSDAFLLSGIIRLEQPQRIVEVGSGFSSAVILDSCPFLPVRPRLTFIEPFPQRLNSLLKAQDRSAVTMLVQRVQEVPLSVFDQLEAHDILFIDSSHVAKIGSDVTFLLLRVLPRLKEGVLVHFHDVFYPDSYPLQWIRQGRAWNESLFLRAFLLQNSNFEIVAFNSFVGRRFPELFQEKLPLFLRNTGASIWLRRVVPSRIRN